MIKKRVVMGMPAVIEVVDKDATEISLEKVFDYFVQMDQIFSTYKKDSDIEKIKRGEITEKDYLPVIKEVLELSEITKKDTNGYFDIYAKGSLDPSGMVKGFAIQKGAEMLKNFGYQNFRVEIAGDIELAGKNSENENWRVGIENPFNTDEVIKVVNLSNKGIATSGSYLRGDHIYNPKTKIGPESIISLTVIGPNIYEADRFATASFAMGEEGLAFIESQKNLAGYMIDKNKIAHYTQSFENYL